ncbi:MAG: hypothetical protein WDO13_15995 [Verrucomicrobiota bacterium]
MKTDVATLQQTVTKLQGDNAALRQQLADLQTSFDQYKADQAKARQALIDNVAEMIASGGARTAHKKKPAAETPPGSASTAPQPAPDRTTEVHTELAAAPPTAPTAPGLAPPPDPDSPARRRSRHAAAGACRAEPQKGYYHVVADGETVADDRRGLPRKRREGHRRANPQGQRAHHGQPCSSRARNFSSRNRAPDL